MSTDAIIEDVSDTAFWVAYFRAKENESAKPLFRDPFAKALIGERGKALADSMASISRYTEWTVLARTVIIDRFIEQAVAGGVDAVINLGAGLDTRPYRMSLPKGLAWIEADYAHIIEHKNTILKSKTPVCRLRRVAIDLSDKAKRKDFFNNVVPDAKRVLVLTEGVIPYLSESETATLAQELLMQRRFMYWVVEYVHQRIYRYLQAAAQSHEMRNAPFKFFPEEWYSFFAKLGWVEKETRYFSEIASEFKREMPAPRAAKIILWFLPKVIKAQILRLSGFVILKRKIG